MDWELDDELCDEQFGLHHTKCCLHAIRIWSFADAHFLPNLQNHAMLELHDAVFDRYLIRLSKSSAKHTK